MSVINKFNVNSTPATLNKDFINVNLENNHETAYSSSTDARNAVPASRRKAGLQITYLLADGWFIDQYVGSDINGWETNSNWNVTAQGALDELNTKIQQETARAKEVEENKVDGVYEDNSEFIRVYKDADGRLLNAITHDGTNYLPKANIEDFYLDNEAVDNDAVKSQTFEQNQEFVKIIKDSDDRILFGIDNNGDIISEYLNKIKKAIPDKEEFILKSDIDYNTFAKKILDSKTMEFASLFPTSGECESFLFFTDPHLGGSNNNFDIDTFYEAMGVVKRYFDATPTSFVLSGGDWLTSNYYQANACEKLGFIDAYMNSHFNSYFPIFGNHDCNYQGSVSADDDSNGNLGNQVLSNLMFRRWGRKYYTFKESITRFYIFDTGIDWNNSMTGNWIEGNYRWEQIDWFANQLIENNDTHIALGMHIISNGNVENWQNGKSEFFKNVIAIAKAFNNKSSITLNEQSYDFTGKEGTIHFVIAGHSHFDYVDESEGIPVIVTANMYRLSVVNFDLIMCDYSNHKLHTIRIGYGNNRSITIK